MDDIESIHRLFCHLLIQKLDLRGLKDMITVYGSVPLL